MASGCRRLGPAADRTLAILEKHGRAAQRIGYARADREKRVRVPAHALVGQHA